MYFLKQNFKKVKSNSPKKQAAGAKKY